jgi:hemerythrin-like domain-containing protein
MNITDAICSLKADHRDFLLLFRDLENAVATADQPNLQRTWAEFERRLAGHIDAEEKYLLPCLRRAHPDEVRLEDETVYKWAEAELDEHHRESLFASLRPIST